MIKPIFKNLIAGTQLERRARKILGKMERSEFEDSPSYWEERYQYGGNSGAGSYGRLAEFKAEIINDFVDSMNVKSVIEFGCGDGNQLRLSTYPGYIGVDVSRTAIDTCREIFKDDESKKFTVLSDYENQGAELSMSLDVIYHLVEDEVFEAHMRTLFSAASRFVVIYASNKDEQPKASHVRHRKFTDWVDVERKDFSLLSRIPNRYPFDKNSHSDTSFADFYFFERKN